MVSDAVEYEMSNVEVGFEILFHTCTPTRGNPPGRTLTPRLVSHLPDVVESGLALTSSLILVSSKVRRNQAWNKRMNWDKEKDELLTSCGLVYHVI